MKLIKVKRWKERVWHYALDSEVNPICVCICNSPATRRKLGDALCKCWCHTMGLALSLTLCEKLDRKYGRVRVVAQQLTLGGEARPAIGARLKQVIGRGVGCQVCQSLAVKLTRKDLEWMIDDIARKSEG